jgi:hypothetical protein
VKPEADPCDYPWHPTRDTNLVKTEKTESGGELRHYRCPTCGAESWASIVAEVKQYG